MVSFRTGGARRRAFAGVGAAGLTLALLAVLGGPSHAAVSDICRVPEAYYALPGDLDRTEALVLNRQPVRVVVLGPAIGASGGVKPSLERALESRLPGINFEIVQTFSPGLAADDFERLRGIVAQTAPDLVIWQVGVRDAMAASDVADFEDVLDRASEWMDESGRDLILVDPPFVPHVRHERIYVPYVGEIGEMARTDGVTVMRRYASMQYLVAEAQKRRAKADAPCMPELMAEFISRAVRP
jgi:hypothetical protein